MHPPSCGPWEYTSHRRAKAVLPTRCEITFNSAKAKAQLIDAFLADTRSAHKQLFGGLTPPNQDYLAGNYRGADAPCLKHRSVSVVGTDSAGRRHEIHRGHEPHLVADAMVELHAELRAAIDELEDAKKTIPAVISEAQFLLFVSAVLAIYLEKIFSIHPYANGNGHVGRLLVAMVLLKLEKRPKKWTLDKRPPYDDAIQKHRDGEKQPLIDLILKAIAG